MVDLDRLRTDRQAFAAAIGLPLTVWQAEALALVKRQTVIAAPRQSGKSRSQCAHAPQHSDHRPHGRARAWRPDRHHPPHGLLAAASLPCPA